MKARIIGIILVLGVLAILGNAAGVFDEGKPGQPRPTAPSDTGDLKPLNIN